MRTLTAVSLAAGLLIGCGQPSADVPSGLDADPWALRSDPELTADIEEALALARRSGRRVLLDFGADWCHDCREVVRLSHQGPARAVLEAEYIVVYINVGRFDRHTALLQEHAVDRIATLVVLDGDGHRLARTTMEPVTDESGLTSEGLAAWLRDPKDG